MPPALETRQSERTKNGNDHTIPPPRYWPCLDAECFFSLVPA